MGEDFAGVAEQLLGDAVLGEVFGEAELLLGVAGLDGVLDSFLADFGDVDLLLAGDFFAGLGCLDAGEFGEATGVLLTTGVFFPLTGDFFTDFGVSGTVCT